MSQEQEVTKTPEVSGPQIRPWVRCWARMMDFLLFSLLLHKVLDAVYPPTLQINNILLMIALLLLYVLVEPIMLTSWGKTPGKALLRVKLRKSTGEKPKYGEALNRSFSVWLNGFALGIPLVSLITLTIAYRKLKENGITKWDKEGNFNVSHRKIGRVRVIVTILLFIVFLFLLGSYE